MLAWCFKSSLFEMSSSQSSKWLAIKYQLGVMAFKCVLSILNIALNTRGTAAVLQYWVVQQSSRCCPARDGLLLAALPQLTDHTSSSRSEQGRSFSLCLVLTLLLNIHFYLSFYFSILKHDISFPTGHKYFEKKILKIQKKQKDGSQQKRLWVTPRAWHRCMSSI